MKSKIQTNVFLGNLGAGKTTIILSLIKQLPKDYKVVWLKNEYGDVNIDSELAKENNIKTAEIMNGCICCVLIGRLGDAIKEIQEKYNPERLIIETAGTAYPFPIINEINKNPNLDLDSILNVIDILNFDKFGDKGHLAREQAEYIDLVILNKVELAKEKFESEKIEDILDEIYDLYPDTPKIESRNGEVDKEIILGIDSKLPELAGNNSEELHHIHNDSEITSFSFENTDKTFTKEEIENLLRSLNPSDYYRIKGIIKLENDYFLLNYVYGRITWEKVKRYNGNSKITFIGKGIVQNDVLDKLFQE
jgi:G3E family GTPase